MLYRPNRRLSAWREVDRIQREMNRLFHDANPSRQRTAAGYPAMNVWADDQSTLVTAEVPGVQAEEIDISVVGEALTLRGSRQHEDPPEGARFHRRERGFGKFARNIQLPYSVDVDNVQASFKNGVLSILLPRAEVDKPRKIVIKRG